VTRYLIDGEDSCTQYHENTPITVIDPFMPTLKNFKLVFSNATTEIWSYNEYVGENNIHQVSTMITGPGGEPPMMTDIWTYEGSGDDHLLGTFHFEYSNQSDDPDDSIFNLYKNYLCLPVSNFTEPNVCLSDLLALEYGCA